MKDPEDIGNGGEEAESPKAPLYLPADGFTLINESAEAFYKGFAASKQYFLRDTALVKARTSSTEGITLSIIKPDELPSQLEYVFTVKKKKRVNGKVKSYPVNCDPRDAKALLGCTDEAMKHSLPLRLLAASPLIIERGGKPATLSQGYHREEGGVYVVNDFKVPSMTIGESKELLLDLFADYVWVSSSDLSRAMAQLLSPALKLGNLLGDVDFPLDVGLADKSQGGKTHRMHFTAQVYGEQAYALTKIGKGGVGSTDELIGAALVAGKLFILIDNVRGHFSAEILESTLRGSGSITVRIPYRAAIQVPTRRSCWQLTSNAAAFTTDLANRSIVTNHRKPAALKAGETRKCKAGWGDEVYLNIQRDQARYLGAVHAIVGEWIRQGKPRTHEHRHNFTVWVQSMDYVVTEILGLPKLMDDHETSHNVLSNPTHAWLRQVMLVVAKEFKLPHSMRTNEIGDTSDENSIDIPNFRPHQGDSMSATRTRNQHIGKLLAPLFKEEQTVRIEKYSLTLGKGMNDHGNEYNEYTLSD
jgi:hypothetical protein